MTPPSYTPGAALAGIAAAGQVRIFMQVDTPITVAVPRYGHLLDARLAAVACGRWPYADQGGGRPDPGIRARVCRRGCRASRSLRCGMSQPGFAARHEMLALLVSAVRLFGFTSGGCPGPGSARVRVSGHQVRRASWCECGA